MRERTPEIYTANVLAMRCSGSERRSFKHRAMALVRINECRSKRAASPARPGGPTLETHEGSERKKIKGGR
jgi:hypothetical protein